MRKRCAADESGAAINDVNCKMEIEILNVLMRQIMMA